MAEQQIISSVASSSGFSSTASSRKYDVFLSFRGEDIRTNFTSHLHEALKQKKVETFIDYRLEKGDKISDALIEAIEDSRVSVVILSKNYASSKWCLEELSKILECKRKQGQIVKPVFYQIDPSHVRNQTGSYKKAFEKHERKGEAMVNKWKAALTEIANLVGWDSRNRIESELLKEIVGDILQKLTLSCPNQLEGLVGIEENFEEVESRLKIASGGVKVLGIWGMGGIGKTTLARSLYAKLSTEFEVGCFLEKVNESSNRDGFEALRNKLFAKLLEDENHCFDAPFLVPDFVWRRLGRKKVLIVLDDVATTQQLQNLIKDYNLLGPESRVIVTTRDKKIFRERDEIYEVKKLSFDHSLELFCLTAFEEKQPKHGYENLSGRAISYCKGVPLALKVLGKRLGRRKKEARGSELEKLEQIPNAEIRDILKSSYDGLDDDSLQDVFLDIACFFKGESRDWVTEVLDACELFASSGIEDLLDKALITISPSGCIEMHDLIQQMGREVVRQESIEDPGKRSRLWKHEEVLEVLKHNQGTIAIGGITLDLDKLTEDLPLRYNSFTKMTKIRVLKIHGSSHQRFNVHFPDGLELLSDKLRYLHWNRFCLESLPSNFCAEHLVELHMPNSKIKKLWDGIQNMVNLKTIILSGSQDLIEMPDLSKAEKLETVYLDDCENLRKLHQSMSSLPRLTFLDARNCKAIERINVHSKYLRKLYLDGCASLKKLSVTSKELTGLSLPDTNIWAFSSTVRGCNDLNLDGTNVESFPANIKSFPLLESLNLFGGRETMSLPELPPSLESLDLKNCRELVSLPELPPSLKFLYSEDCRELVSLSELPPSLTRLNLRNCVKLVSLPELPPSLERLDLTDCRELVSLPELPPSLDRLDLKNCTKLVSLPELPPSLTRLDLTNRELVSVRKLPPSLESLDLQNCRQLVSLPEFPPSLKFLYLKDCRELVSLPELPPSLASLDLTDCRQLVSLPELPPSLESLDLQNCRQIVSLPEFPPSLKFLYLKDCRELVSLPELPPSLASLDLTDCRQLVSLPELPSSLESLDLQNCRKLVSLPELPPFLKFLYLKDCRELVSLPKLPPSLASLDLTDCRQLVSLPELPLSLESLDLQNCRKFMSLSELPPSLKFLYLKDCRKLMSLPELPPSLASLDLTDCRQLVSLPKLPPSLESLDLQNCRQLVSLPELPPSLKFIYLKDCRELVSLPELPPSLASLDLTDCRQLVSLPELPPSLESLDLQNCRKLVSMPELPPSLNFLYLKDCRELVSVPELPPSLRKP